MKNEKVAKGRIIGPAGPCSSSSSPAAEAGPLGPSGEDIEATIQEKLHKSEVARLRKAFSDERNNTLNLFQFFLTSEYSQLVKLLELAECYLVRMYTAGEGGG